MKHKILLLLMSAFLWVSSLAAGSSGVASQDDGGSRRIDLLHGQMQHGFLRAEPH